MENTPENIEEAVKMLGKLIDIQMEQHMAAVERLMELVALRNKYIKLTGPLENIDQAIARARDELLILSQTTMSIAAQCRAFMQHISAQNQPIGQPECDTHVAVQGDSQQ